MSLNSWEKERENKVKELEEIIVSYLPKQEGFQKVIMEAMEYSLMAGGKRLRPMLMMETYRDVRRYFRHHPAVSCGTGDDSHLLSGAR